MSLPRSLDELAGRRAARWTRESTAGQFDAFGPEAQCEQQDRAIERWGLRDIGLTYEVAHSGRTVGTTAQFTAMMAAAGVEYDVLVVGYVSRFARDLRTAVNARHDLHVAGAAILFADERLLTSEEDRWDEWAREAVEAESYSRKLGRRIREGYAAKRRRLGEPGGRPPYGYRREGHPPRLATDGERMGRVRACYEQAASGVPDQEVAQRIGLPLDTVRGILTNPIYVGQLRDGSPASVAPMVDVETWNTVQRLRSVRRTRGGRPETVRTYALPMLRCAACGRRLIGESGRYRHRDVCPSFLAARRRRRYSNGLVRVGGASYPQAFYEGTVGSALEQLGLGAGDLAAAALHMQTTKHRQSPDRLELRRIEAERDRALARYRATRDLAALEAAMARLDAEERENRTDIGTVSAPSWDAVRPYLVDLSRLWRDAEPAERRQLADRMFVAIDALGCRELTITPSAEAIAHGLVGAQFRTVVGATGFGPVTVRIRAPHVLTPTERARSA